MPSSRRHQFSPNSAYFPSETEQAAIEEYVSSQGLALVSVSRGARTARLVARGVLLLSNLATIWVAHVEADGREGRIYVAFDPMRDRGTMQVLLEQPESRE